MAHDPIVTPQDLEQFVKTGAYVKWEQRQPAAVSWWLNTAQVGFTKLAAGQVLRMSTSPAGKTQPRTLDWPTV